MMPAADGEDGDQQDRGDDAAHRALTPFACAGPPRTLLCGHSLGRAVWSECGEGVAPAGRGSLDSVTSHWYDSAVPDDARYSLTELADLAGVTPRTVRYYLPRGLLPSSGRSGPGAKYGDEHLARLRLIRRLQRRAPAARRDPPATGRPRRRRGALARGRGGPGTDGLRARLPAQGPRAGAAPGPALPSGPGGRPGARPPDWPRSRRRAGARHRCRASRPPPPTTPTEVVRPPANAGDRSQWERIVLAPDVELHVRRPLSRIQNKRVDRLLTIARELLEEDRP